MEIPFLSNNSFGSFGDIPGGNFSLKGQQGNSSFIPDSGDISDNFPGDSLSLGSFSQMPQLDLLEALDELMEMLMKFFTSLLRKLGLDSKLPGSDEFAGFGLDGSMPFSSGDQGSIDQEYFNNDLDGSMPYSPGDEGSDQGGDSFIPEESVNAGQYSKSSNGDSEGPANGKYDPIIEKYAKQYGVDPAVIKAIIAQESQGDSHAVSPAGAVGLMQVKPETASELLGRHVTAEELKNDPELNIKVGTMYFAKLMEEKGSLEDALGAYNQGPYADWRSTSEGTHYVSVITNALDSGTLPQW